MHTDLPCTPSVSQLAATLIFVVERCVCCLFLCVEAHPEAVLPHQVRVNFPNGDMVGHTGKLQSTITACTATDKAVKVRPWTH